MEKSIQGDLAKSVFVRLGTYATLLVVATFVFLIIVAAIFGVSYLANIAMQDAVWVNPQKLQKGIKFFQSFFVGLDAFLFITLVFKATWMMIIKGKVLN